MLEAMQEKSVTAGGEIRKLAEPFFVLATQNPIDQEGTYPLPEAQLDRFFFKLIVGYPSGAELTEVLTRTTEGGKPDIARILVKEQIIELQKLVRQVPVAGHVKDYAVRLVLATHPKSNRPRRSAINTCVLAAVRAAAKRSCSPPKSAR